MKRLLSLVLIFAACSLIPARPASAQGGFIRWLEKLSGPGPFKGYAFELRPLCFGRSDATGELGQILDIDCGAASHDHLRLMVGVQYARLSGDNNLKYDATAPADQTKTVHANTFLVLADVGVLRWLDLGGSVGRIQFSGTPAGSFNRLMFEPLRVSVTPAAVRRRLNAAQIKKSGLVQVRFTMAVLGGQYTDATFGAMPGNLNVQTEVVSTVSVIVNLLSLR